MNNDNNNFLPDLGSEFGHKTLEVTELGPHNHAPQIEPPKDTFNDKFKEKVKTIRSHLPLGKSFIKTSAIIVALGSLASLSIEAGAIAYQNSKKQTGIQYVYSQSSSPIFSLGSDEGTEELPTIQPNTHYSLLNQSVTVKVTAPMYLVGDVETGEIIIDKGSSLKSPMASVSKLMTAVVTMQNIDLNHLATVSRGSYNTFGSEGELVLGEKIKTGDLLYPLLVESSNDAAEVLAEDYGRDQFMSLVNEKAQALGMKDTYYDDPSGLSPQNVSTVTDLFKLTQYIYHNLPHIWDITRVKEYATRTHLWKNENQLLNYPEYAGGKNGYIDEARWTTATLFTLPLGKDGEKRTVALILLRSENRSGDAAALLQYLKKNVVYSSTDTSANTSNEPVSQSASSSVSTSSLR